MTWRFAQSYSSRGNAWAMTIHPFRCKCGHLILTYKVYSDPKFCSPKEDTLAFNYLRLQF